MNFTFDGLSPLPGLMNKLKHFHFFMCVFLPFVTRSDMFKTPGCKRDCGTDIDVASIWKKEIAPKTCRNTMNSLSCATTIFICLDSRQSCTSESSWIRGENTKRSKRFRASMIQWAWTSSRRLKSLLVSASRSVVSHRFHGRWEPSLKTPLNLC